MKDINATIVIDLKGKTLDEIWRSIKYTRRKYVRQGLKAGLSYVQAFSERDLRKMYDMHMRTLLEGGTTAWTYEKWRTFVSPAGDRFYYVKKRRRIVGCFILAEITSELYGDNPARKGIRPLVYASKRKYHKFRPNDYMYWVTIKYAIENGYDFVDLGGWQIKARGHLKNINKFKEEWGGRIVYYYLDYPFFTALRRKLIRNIGLFWWINLFIKKAVGKINSSYHDDLIRNAAARSRTSISST